MLGVCLKYTQHNYGSKLQALATVKMFENLNIDYEIIRYNKKTISFYIKSIPRIFNFVFLNDRYDEIQKKIILKRNPEIKKLVDIRESAFDQFDINFNNHLSKIFPSYENLKQECANNYNMVITCSDQLWSPSALASGFYNLMFVPEKTLKCSWASSFGVKKIPWYQVKRTKKYLNRIQSISMRENRGAEIVKELTGRDVPVLMDPVFAFSKNEWDQLIEFEDCSKYGEYIFCYFLGDNPIHRKAAKILAEKTGLKIVTLRHLDRFVANDEEFGTYAPYDVGPETFLNILRNAKYICTDSFHGTAFSIIYEKKFIVFNRYDDSSSNSKNTRIDSICENLSLSKRRFKDINTIYENMIDSIDYNHINEYLKIYRQKTIDYLKRVLNEQKN